MKRSTFYILSLLMIATSALGETFGNIAPNMIKSYFSKGGWTTVAVAQFAGKGIKTKSSYTAIDAVLTKSGDMYVLVEGNLLSETNTFIIELPIKKSRKGALKHEKKNGRSRGATYLKKKHFQTGESGWIKCKSKGRAPISISPSENGTLFEFGDRRLTFRGPSYFSYGENKDITSHEKGLGFVASPKRKPNKWAYVFTPFTYVFDVITSPIQLTVGIVVMMNV